MAFPKPRATNAYRKIIGTFTREADYQFFALGPKMKCG